MLQSGESRERLMDVRHRNKTAGDRRQANLDISKSQIRVRFLHLIHRMRLIDARKISWIVCNVTDVWK